MQVEWSPVDTAPKDGTAVLVFDRESETIVVARRDAVQDYRQYSPTYGEKSWPWTEATGEEFETYEDVTHWMPLPPRPRFT